MSDIGDTLCRCGHPYSEHSRGIFECCWFSNDEDGVTYCGCENFEATP